MLSGLLPTLHISTHSVTWSIVTRRRSAEGMFLSFSVSVQRLLPELEKSTLPSSFFYDLDRLHHLHCSSRLRHPGLPHHQHIHPHNPQNYCLRSCVSCSLVLAA